MNEYQDGTGRPIAVGDRVWFRGQIYTITGFGPHYQAGARIATIQFDRPPHTGEVPDEVSVDLVERGG